VPQVVGTGDLSDAGDCTNLLDPWLKGRVGKRFVRRDPNALQDPFGLAEYRDVVQCRIKSQPELIAFVADMQLGKLLGRHQHLLAINSIEGAICEKEAQQENKWTENKRQVKR
jgi:hypothetical protein